MTYSGAVAAPRQTAQFRTAARLLFLLVLTFATLVPGGPVETRDFSHLRAPVFWSFNIFLVSLGIMALLSAAGMRRGQPLAAWGAIAAGWGYIFVVFLDLGRVFPVSPDPMPLLLGLVEILDVTLAAYVMALAHKGLGHL